MQLNRIIGVVAFALSVCLFVVSNSAAALALALCTLCIPLASQLIGRATMARTGIALSHKESTVAGSDMLVEIEVSRPAFFRGRIDLALERKNELTGTVERMPVSLAPAKDRPERFSLPLSALCCGRVSLSLVSCQVADVFGFHTVPLSRISHASSYCVYPPIVDLTVQMARADRASAQGATYDPHRHGQDPTEVFETREYRDGDSMKAVHWKLSARFDDLMVREPSHPTDYDVMIAVHAHACDAGDAQAAGVLDATLSIAASVGLAFLREGICYTCARIGADGSPSVGSIDSRESYDEALDRLVSIPLSEEGSLDVEQLEAHLRTRNVTKVVLVTDKDDEALFESLGALVDLSVFHISPKGYSGLDVQAGYRLTHLPADEVGVRVKSLEL